MTFLPIVHRELRAAARRKSTFRIRSWTAVIAMLISLCSLPIIILSSMGTRGNPGTPLFSLLTAYTFGLCLLAGVFFTSSSFTEEKREGTLGLLFLTDLHGYDIVLGKFMAVSLNAFYGLLALLPVLALPLLLGGVTGGEFWRSALALINMIFCSLAAGMFVSALARDSRTAMGITFALVVFLVGGLPALADIGAQNRISPAWLSLAWISPFYSFSSARDAVYATQQQKFWATLAASHLLGWLFLALASRLLPNRWQSGTVAMASDSLFRRLFRRGRGGAAQRARARARLLPINPVLWLIGGDPGLRWLLWLIVLAWAVLLFLARSQSVTDPLWVFRAAKGCGFLLKSLVAFQACRFFAEARRNGSLELLLSTPLRNREIIQGQWMALRRIFFWPLLVFVLLNLMPYALQISSLFSGAALSQIGAAMLGVGVGFFSICWLAIGLLADFFAVGWLGMWLALASKRPHLAPAMTVLLVLVLPSVGICGLDLIADLFFILWGATRLQQDLRWVVAQQYQRAASTALPPPARLGPIPPPIIPTRRNGIEAPNPKLQAPEKQQAPNPNRLA